MKSLRKSWEPLIGNDIVDLKKATAESDWTRDGYLRKIFTPGEQRMIHSARYPGLMVWLFWSIKESAYKVVNRLDGIRKYNPLAFECSAPDVYGIHTRAIVSHEGCHLSTELYINRDLVHCIAVREANMLAAVNVHYMKNTPDYLEVFNATQRGTKLKKSRGGLPEIVNPSDYQVTPASVSHHGRFLAVTYLDFLR